MTFRTLAFALALDCSLTAIGEAKKKPTVVHGPYKAGKVKKFKASKYKGHKQVVKKHVVKHS